ncbi:uncharacterized protein E0L32_011050 [Thyridium curvatum]|uniref:Aromatic prenyltransferase n=1 Tax=Thyridium curvatum TaxID=1093900 RepID=A0A507AEZ0_9PEZI|nr:uncharacterized protein E0L32_011050 [Thyridium curvatum]TPX07062.1 hypothetical protein E0L32_011050 [Thyridium curvatum]
MATDMTPWETLGATLCFKSKDAQFWWDGTGRMFAKLIEHAGYSIEEQYRELQFYALFVAPQLGPAPDESMPWQSLKTPDSTPIDFSWEWRSDKEAILRYAFEPIVAAGTHSNTLRSPTETWLKTLKSQNLIPGLDLEWYNHFVSMMVPPNIGHKGFGASFYKRTAPEYGTSVAVDVNKSGKAVKAYFWPSLNANALDISTLECVKRAIRALPAEQLESLQVESAFEFLDQATERWNLTTGLFSIDCLKPQNARIKIYVSSPWISREFLLDVLTMGGRLPSPDEIAFSSLSALWDTFLGDAPDRLPDDVMAKSTPGFYMTLGHGGAKSVKMYMSPQHWCATDGEVLSRLRQYFASQNQSDTLMNKYESAVRQTLGSALVDGRCGSHFYIGSEPSKGRPRMVTYMSPQTYLIERGRMQQAPQLPLAPSESSEEGEVAGVGPKESLPPQSRKRKTTDSIEEMAFDKHARASHLNGRNQVPSV